MSEGNPRRASLTSKINSFRSFFKDGNSIRSAEIFLPKRHLLHLEGAAPEIVEYPCIRRQVKGELIGVKGLAGLPVATVFLSVSVLAVPRSGQPRSAMVARI